MSNKQFALNPDVLGELSQIGIVTSNLSRSIDDMLRLGIGPWSVYTFDEHSCTDLTYLGKRAHFSARIALAYMPGLNWELIQPLRGDSIYADFLSKGEGLHHLLFKCDGLDWQKKKAALEVAGYSCIQSGKWQGTLSFAYFSKEDDAGVLIEIVDIPPMWIRPKAEEVRG